MYSLSKKSFISENLITSKRKYCYSILFPGSRRLSVGALMGLQIHRDDGEVIKKTKAAIASSYGSTPGVTQGGVTKIRNKTIPIINPMVKSSNWPQSSYKKGKFSKKRSCYLLIL